MSAENMSPARLVRHRVFRVSVAVLLFLAVFCVVTDAWRLNLRNPITYWGDALEMASYYGRDYVFNDLHERLFAPFGADHSSPLRYGLNLLFQANSTLFIVAYWITQDVIAALNLYYLATFPLVFLSAYWVYGRLRLPAPFGFLGATLYALMPFHFQRGEGHLIESSYFLVPLLSYILVLTFRSRPFFHRYARGGWEWSWRDKQDWFFVGAMVFLSSLNEYHQFFFVMLLALAAVASWLRHRNYRILVGAAILLVATVGSTIGKTCIAHVLNEPGLELSQVGVPIAAYGDAERFGLKMIQVVLPVGGHNFPPFRSITQTYNTAHEVNENSTVALGLLGAAGFVYLLVNGIAAIVGRKKHLKILDLLSLLTLACVLIATIGGGASAIGTASKLLLGPDSLLTQVRGYNRIIVFIGFFSYYASAAFFAIVARRVSNRATGPVFQKAAYGVISAPILIFALWDQVPFRFINDRGEARRHASDREFFMRVEAEMPARSLIFQYPFNIHHANVSNSGTPPYNYADGIRPYLNTQTLRFTYGGDNGSAQIKWLQETAALPVESMLPRLCEYGFSGILIHRKLFSSAAEAADLEARITTALGASLEESIDKDFSFARVDNFCQRRGIARLEAPNPIKLLQDQTSHLHIVPGSVTSHLTGQFDVETKAMVAVNGEEGALMYGPYATLVHGRYRATFLISAEATADGTEVGLVDVNGFEGSASSAPLASAALKAAPGEQEIQVTFQAGASSTLYEFRVFVNGKQTRVSVRGVEVEKL
jgi:phosphoglycerol transferase